MCCNPSDTTSDPAEWSSGHAPGAVHKRLGLLDPSALPACADAPLPADFT